MSFWKIKSTQFDIQICQFDHTEFVETEVMIDLQSYTVKYISIILLRKQKHQKTDGIYNYEREA